MLAPLRDYLLPQDPTSSPLLCATKDCYFTRMSVKFDTSTHVFRESRWIATEDLNVEHLVDVFTSVEVDAGKSWVACHGFLKHLYWHKPRLTVLGQKIEGLPDDHWCKPDCLFQLANLFKSVGNFAERKRLLNQTLKVVKERGDEDSFARILSELSDTNRNLGLFEEGIQQAREALEVYRRLGTTSSQAWCLNCLAWLLYADKQLDASKEAVSLAVDLLPEKGQEHMACQLHRLLGNIYCSGDEREKAIHHFRVALEIMSPFEWHDQLFWIHLSLAQLFLDEGTPEDVHAHIEQAKSFAGENSYYLGRTMELQALMWCHRWRPKEAKSEASRAFETFEKLGAAEDLERCRTILQGIEKTMKSQPTSDIPDSNSELLE